MATQENIDKVQKIYIAYYGRPADPAGLAFWASQLETAGGDLNIIIDQFGTSAEYQDRFGALSNENLVNNIYQFLFNRDAESAGKTFYVGKLDAGEMSLGTIALNILDGSLNNDLALIENKLSASNSFTPAIERYDIPYGPGQIDSAKAILDGITTTMDDQTINDSVNRKVLGEFRNTRNPINGTAGDDILETTLSKDEIKGNGGNDTIKIKAIDPNSGLHVPQSDKILDYQSNDTLVFDSISAKTITSDISTATKIEGYDPGVSVTVDKGFVKFVSGESVLNLEQKTDFVFDLIDANSFAIFQHQQNTYLMHESQHHLIELVGVSMTALGESAGTENTVVLG